MKLARRTYADHYGPTTGDRIRLADTELLVRIERDLTTYGDEAKFGGGKVIRDGMGQSPTATRAGGRARPGHHLGRRSSTAAGIYKADVGIRDGRISAIGKAGNPGIMDGVTPGLEIGASTEILAGEGQILTAGGIDAHVHFISPNQIPDAFHSGHHDAHRRRHRPGDRHQRDDLHARAPGTSGGCTKRSQAFPLNFGFLGKGNASTRRAAARADSRRRDRLEAARGLGHDAGGDRSRACRSPTSSTCRWRFTPTR